MPLIRIVPSAPAHTISHPAGARAPGRGPGESAWRTGRVVPRRDADFGQHTLEVLASAGGQDLTITAPRQPDSAAFMLVGAMNRAHAVSSRPGEECTCSPPHISATKSGSPARCRRIDIHIEVPRVRSRS